MTAKSYKYLYGPVPSRRLGRSLGLDLVPFKTCNYDCIYCQLGRTTRKTVARREYIPIQILLAELRSKLAESDKPDFITLAGSGEPTLNSGIGDLIKGIKRLTGIPVAALTNGSLLWLREVRDALSGADLVLPSLDAGDEDLFRYVNRPHASLGFQQMVGGLEDFTAQFAGEVWLEVLLLAGVTGFESEVHKIAALVGRIGPARVQLNTVSRPPAEDFAFGLGPERMHAMKRLFPGRVEFIGGDLSRAPDNDIRLGASDADILSLLARRPCTCADVAAGLGIHPNEAVKQLEALCDRGKAQVMRTAGEGYYTTRRKRAKVR